MSKKVDIFLSSNSDEHQTPQWLFDYFDKIFNFDLDVCASKENTKCERFFDRENSALTNDFEPSTFFWMNPPYSAPEQKCKPVCAKKTCEKRGHHLDSYKPGCIDFVKYAYEQYIPGVMLLKNDPTTNLFSSYVWRAEHVIFLRKRVKYELPEKKQTSAPHSSVVAIFRRSLTVTEKKYISKIGEIK